MIRSENRMRTAEGWREHVSIKKGAVGVAEGQRLVVEERYVEGEG